ncbi:hypothetical protein [uncultured Gordonia sp.]|uniref:hypothetical protein n=1 Tax=uncultured Gordonia sp. TaxID=198437 RepID=UPI002590CC01|nr:hypothetical protein [uncultured Gordonia sp.]
MSTRFDATFGLADAAGGKQSVESGGEIRSQVRAQRPVQSAPRYHSLDAIETREDAAGGALDSTLSDHFVALGGRVGFGPIRLPSRLGEGRCDPCPYSIRLVHEDAGEFPVLEADRVHASVENHQSGCDPRPCQLGVAVERIHPVLAAELRELVRIHCSRRLSRQGEDRSPVGSDKGARHGPPIGLGRPIIRRIRIRSRHPPHALRGAGCVADERAAAFRLSPDREHRAVGVRWHDDARMCLGIGRADRLT